jgi:hypothetical protein
METAQLIQLPDGTYAAVVRSATYGELTVILILVALLFLQVYALWSMHALAAMLISVRGTNDTIGHQ